MPFSLFNPRPRMKYNWVRAYNPPAVIVTYKPDHPPAARRYISYVFPWPAGIPYIHGAPLPSDSRPAADVHYHLTPYVDLGYKTLIRIKIPDNADLMGSIGKRVLRVGQEFVTQPPCTMVRVERTSDKYTPSPCARGRYLDERMKTAERVLHSPS